MTQITRSQVNGYAVPPLPATLPPAKMAPVSLQVAVREAAFAIYGNDEVLRERLGSLTNSDAQTGNYHADKTLAAQTLLVWIQRNRPESVRPYGERAIGWIKSRGIPKLLKKLELDRQSRYRQALVGGQHAEAA